MVGNRVKRLCLRIVTIPFDGTERPELALSGTAASRDSQRRDNYPAADPPMDETMPPVKPQVTVFLPCHALDDLPDWLDEHEADAVLSAWTVAWHPAALVGAAGLPDWASLDLPWTRDGRVVGLVPPGMSERFQAGVSPSPHTDQEFLHEHDADQLQEALLIACGAAAADAPVLTDWQREQVDDFRGLGLSMLLAERLARRMRTETNLETTGFPEAVLAAATAWYGGDEVVARARLAEAFGCLEAVRDHYYAVECWCLDLVLLTEQTIAGLVAELDSPAALSVLATPETLERLATQPMNIRDSFRRRVEAGSLAAVGSMSATIPIALISPEHLEAEVTRGREAWEKAVGVWPNIYAQQSGPVAPLLPQVLSRVGYRGVLWNSFDGRSLPEPGMTRFQWEFARAQIEATAPRLLDVRSAATILSLPTVLGDAMDHDHTVIVMFCHHAGTAGPWFELLRRVASWSSVFGRFVTPDTLLTETADSAGTVRFPSDAFPLRLAPETPLDSQLKLLRDEASQLLNEKEAVTRELSAMGCVPGLVEAETPANCKARGQTPSGQPGWLSRWWRREPTDADQFVLTTDGLQLRVHKGSGGIVSVRRSKTGRNLLSQQLAFRWPDTSAGPSTAWRPAPAAYSRMVADSIERREQAILSRGRLLDVAGETLAAFTQTVSLLSENAAAEIQLVIEPTPAAAGLPKNEGDPWGRYLACRFAWNENDFCDVFRSLQTQLVATERQRFCSPWLMVLASEGGGLARGGRGSEAEVGSSRLQLFCGGLPWHVRSSPHTVDTLLATDFPVERLEFRMALGIELAAASERSISWAAGGPLTAACTVPGLPGDVRLTSACRLTDSTGLVGLRLRLLESTGSPHQLQLDWSRPIVRASRRSPAVIQRPEVEGVTVVGTTVEYSLSRNEWVELEIWFSHDHHA